jgi:hypothetical protein
MENAREHFEDTDLDAREQLFNRTVSVIFDRIMGGTRLPTLSRATVEALFVGIAKNIDSAEQRQRSQLKGLFSELRSAEEFRPENLKNAITTKVKLIARMRRAVSIFAA